MSPNVVAIIPARGGSKGIPRKNIQDVCGKPLVAYTIEQALAAEHITRVVVNSEDREIREASVAHGAEAMDRPEEFHHDNSIQEVDRLLIWCVAELEKTGPRIDCVVLLYPTGPLRSVATIDRAVRMVLEEGYDSVLSLYEDSTYLWRVNPDGTVEPTNYDPRTRGPRQKEAWNQWAENKAVYAMRRDLLMDTRCRLGGRTGHVEMSRLDSIDVDRPEDLELVRVLMAARIAAGDGDRS
jgi:CMP-N,N'-diacetyllegionaminic acid synthase